MGFEMKTWTDMGNPSFPRDDMHHKIGHPCLAPMQSLRVDRMIWWSIRTNLLFFHVVACIFPVGLCSRPSFGTRPVAGADGENRMQNPTSPDRRSGALVSWGRSRNALMAVRSLAAGIQSGRCTPRVPPYPCLNRFLCPHPSIHVHDNRLPGMCILVRLFPVGKSSDTPLRGRS
ncbi:hypothetical protein N656DRAFT_4350 [Canariomyces notabilis]|uniref:Uncharacterized protein n=1 Tax=Canariomyces notabilis TaxID=2074819 RepID=A0AAN6TM58_9PEZI|nr:hypothetical protein N656DRAFT_4350 [Canariomyces arenarius]